MQQTSNEITQSKNAIFLAFLSGKGGVGKTSIALSLAKVLSLVDYKVLLIDADLQTHGLSYFFTDLTENQNKTGLLEIMRDFQKSNQSINQFDLNSVIVKVSHNLDFIPSKKAFKEKTWQLAEDAHTVRAFMDRLMQQLANAQYDFIISDTQAGPAAATREVCSRSGKAIIISEPDPISIAASRSLDYEMHEELPNFTRFLVNKLEKEEVRSFRAIRDYLTIFEHVSPLPFDFDVRKAFSVRNIPIDPDSPSAFLFGIVELAKQILPLSSDRMNEFEADLNKRVFGTIQEKRDEYDKLIRDMSLETERLQFAQERYEAMISRRFSLMLSTIMIAATVAIISYLIYFRVVSLSAAASIIVIAVIASLAPIILERIRTSARRRKTELQLMISNQLERLSDLKREKDKYDAMLLEKQERFMTDLK